MEDIIFLLRGIFHAHLSVNNIKQLTSILVGSKYLIEIGDFGHYYVNVSKGSLLELRTGFSGMESEISLELAALYSAGPRDFLKILEDSLQKQTGLSPSQIERYAATASKRYKTYPIEKRTGGYRVISQPSRPIKALQRWLINDLFSQFPIHDCATAYSKGSSIRENAVRHVNSNFTLHADFQSFFPSFYGSHVKDFLEIKCSQFKIALSAGDISFVRRIVSRNEALTIGAPSSPIVTNTLMYDFDQLISDWCNEREIIFTRYADDMYFSSISNSSLADVLAQLAAITKQYPFADLKLNNEKTAFLSRRYRRSVTGLIITPDHQVSIGLERKSHLKSQIYKFTKGSLDSSEWPKTGGLIAFAKDVEPVFYETLIRKYGLSAIDRLLMRKSNET
jgi:hypothetical protein